MMKINLIEYFEESVQRCPQKTAVIDRDRTITFSELRGKALVRMYQAPRGCVLEQEYRECVCGFGDYLFW